jgi:hypothetical protein
MSPRQLTTGMQFLWRVMIVGHLAFAWGLLAFVGLNGFAYSDDVQSVQAAVVGLSKDVELWQLQQTRAALEARDRALDQEIFSIEDRIADLLRQGVVPDEIYTQRLAALKSEHAAVSREIEALLAAHPELSKARAR